MGKAQTSILVRVAHPLHERGKQLAKASGQSFNSFAIEALIFGLITMKAGRIDLFDKRTQEILVESGICESGIDMFGNPYLIVSSTASKIAPHITKMLLRGEYAPV